MYSVKNVIKVFTVCGMNSYQEVSKSFTESDIEKEESLFEGKRIFKETPSVCGLSYGRAAVFLHLNNFSHAPHVRYHIFFKF